MVALMDAKIRINQIFLFLLTFWKQFSPPYYSFFLMYAKVISCKLFHCSYCRVARCMEQFSPFLGVALNKVGVHLQVQAFYDFLRTKHEVVDFLNALGVISDIYVCVRLQFLVTSTNFDITSCVCLYQCSLSLNCSSMGVVFTSDGVFLIYWIDLLLNHV